MDFLRARAIQALVTLVAAAAPGAQANCSAMNGTYVDDSVEKIEGSPRTLSSFASPKDRARLVRREQSGPKPTFGGPSQVMQRPKTVKLVSRVALLHGAELKFRFFDESGVLLAETSSITPRKWNCVSGRLERKFQTMSGLGEAIRTEELEQVLMAAPGGDLVLIETTTVVDGPKSAPKRVEVHFKRVEKG